MFDILIWKGKKDSTRTIHRHGWKKRRRSLRWTISAGYRSKRMEKGNFEFLVDHRGRNRGRDLTMVHGTVESGRKTDNGIARVGER